MRGRAQTCICHQKKKNEEKSEDERNKGERKNATAKARLTNPHLTQYAKQKKKPAISTLYMCFFFGGIKSSGHERTYQV